MDLQTECLARFNNTHCPSCDLNHCSDYDDNYCISACPSFYYFELTGNTTGELGSADSMYDTWTGASSKYQYYLNRTRYYRR